MWVLHVVEKLLKSRTTYFLNINNNNKCFFWCQVLFEVLLHVSYHFILAIILEVDIMTLFSSSETQRGYIAWSKPHSQKETAKI